MSGHPYWYDTLGVSSHQSPVGSLAGPFDVAVLGAGYTGLSAALQLAKTGASVAVFDRGMVGSGASSRNGGQVLTGFKLEAKELVARFGEARARQLFDVSRDAIATVAAIVGEERIDCDFERTGHLQAAAKPSHFEAFKEDQALLARVFDHHVRLVTPADQPAELGARGYHGLLLDEESRAINPARYVHGLAAAARRAGAVVVENTAVERMTRTDREWTLTTTAGEVRARDVLVATNGYTDKAAPALQRRLIPIGSYVIATAPLPPEIARRILPTRRMAFDSRYFLHYFRLTPDNRLLFGGRAEFSGPTLESATRAEAILRRAMTETFPELASTPIDYSWSGHVAFTRDQMPHAGRMDGTFYAGGYCGHGIAMATYLGRLVARRMAGEQIEHPLFDDHFPPIPLYYGRPWFLPFVGLYYRWLDWIS